MVCLDEIRDDTDNRKLQCQHYFHSKCIAGWFQHQATMDPPQNPSCPHCRCVSITDCPEPPSDIENEYDWNDENESVDTTGPDYVYHGEVLPGERRAA